MRHQTLRPGTTLAMLAFAISTTAVYSGSFANTNVLPLPKNTGNTVNRNANSRTDGNSNNKNSKNENSASGKQEQEEQQPSANESPLQQCFLDINGTHCVNASAIMQINDVFSEENEGGGISSEKSEVIESEEEMENYATSRMAICRRNPTWRGPGVDFEECQRLSGWSPRDKWWKQDQSRGTIWLEGKEAELGECLDSFYELAREEKYWWAVCDETAFDYEACDIDPIRVGGMYKNPEHGDIVSLESVLTEQEAYGLFALVECMGMLLPKDIPFFEERAYGEDEEEGYEMFKLGGSDCNYLQGLLQMYLPGVVSTIYRAINAAYEEAGWGRAKSGRLSSSAAGAINPRELGVRTAEFVEYQRTGRMSTHHDEESKYSISIALSDEDEYDGGYFRLSNKEVLFKVPRLSAVVFQSSTSHGVTEITRGTRRVFVVELWDNDDAPLGVPRQIFDEWDEYVEALEGLFLMAVNDEEGLDEYIEALEEYLDYYGEDDDVEYEEGEGEEAEEEEVDDGTEETEISAEGFESLEVVSA